MEKIIISCLESRVETNRSIYARFLLGPFKDDNAVTIATALRRSLLSKVKSIAITAIHIQGVTHEFSTIVGVRESVLELALNFQQVVLRTKTSARAKKSSKYKGTRVQNFVLQESAQKFKNRNLDSGNPHSKRVAKDENQKLDQPLFTSNNQNKAETQDDTPQIGYLQMQGPAVIYANDLKLPAGIECVDPTQYIATLSTEGLLVLKFVIGKKKTSFDTNSKSLIGKKINESLKNKKTLTGSRSKLFDPTISLRNTIFLDPIFDSVLQANYIIEKDDLFNQSRERIVLEFWTNGSVHPRQALHKASLSLISTFSIFRKVFHLDSL